jgi:hypothetical protein
MNALNYYYYYFYLFKEIKESCFRNQSGLVAIEFLLHTYIEGYEQYSLCVEQLPDELMVQW